MSLWHVDITKVSKTLCLYFYEGTSVFSRYEINGSVIYFGRIDFVTVHCEFHFYEILEVRADLLVIKGGPVVAGHGIPDA